jgi:alpha-galactosidase
MRLENEGVFLDGDGDLRFRRSGIIVRIAASALIGHPTLDAPLPYGGEGQAQRPAPTGGASLAASADTQRFFQAGPVEGTVRLAAPTRGRHAEIRVVLANRSAGPVTLLRQELALEVFLGGQAGGEVPPLSWFRNGWQSWSFSGVVEGASPSIPLPRWASIYGVKEDPAVPSSRAAFVSDMAIAVKLGDNALLAGALPQRFFQRAEVVPGPGGCRLRLLIDLDGERLGPGAVAEIGGWQLESEATATGLLTRWGARVGGRRRVVGPLIGWDSWYERKRAVTAGYVARTVERIKGVPELAPLELVMVDDGWEERVGDWHIPGRRFGGDVAGTARVIREAGLKAGLWLAPFVAQASSRLVKEHPDWVLHREGRPVRLGFNPNWRDFYYALDPRSLGLLDYLCGFLRELKRAGYSVFKLDYLFAGALRGDRGLGSPGRFAAFRSALTAFREAVGEDAILLGCGCPLAPSVGLIDVMRVSTDVAHSWVAPGLLGAVTGDPEISGLLPALRNTLARASFASSFWAVDPDCVMFRKAPGTAVRVELEAFATLAALNGEVLLVGDDVTRWGPAEVAAFAAIMKLVARPPAPDGGSAHTFVPLDSADRVLPVWALASAGGGVSNLAAFNLRDDLEMLSLPSPDFVARLCRAKVSSPTGHKVALVEDRTSVSTIGRHSCALVRIEEDERGAE